MGFSTGPLRLTFDFFVGVPNMGGIRRFGFFKPTVLFPQKALGFGVYPRLVNFRRSQFCGDVFFQ